MNYLFTDCLQQHQARHIYATYSHRDLAPVEAQGAIDSANWEYQARKTVFAARINVMVDYLNQEIPLQQLQQVGCA